jgi:hypothetical protein
MMAGTTDRYMRLQLQPRFFRSCNNAAEAACTGGISWILQTRRPPWRDQNPELLPLEIHFQ